MDDQRPDEAAADERAGWAPWAVALAVVAFLTVIAVAVGGVVLLGSDDEPEAQTVTIVVPRGTAARQARGEAVELMPANLEMRVGDTLRVTNEDIVTQTVGPYIVGPEQTLRQTFQEPGEITGVCTLSASGEVTITVTE